MTHDPWPTAEQPREPSILGRFSRDRIVHPGLLLVPFWLAAVLFRPQGVYPNEDRMLSVLSTVRGYLAVALVLAAIVRYDPQALWTYPTNTINSASNAAVVSIGVVLVVSLVVSVLVLPGHRRRASKALARPIFTIVLLLACLYGAERSGLVVIAVEPPALSEFGPSGGTIGLDRFLLMMASNVAKLWLLAFFATALFFIAKHAYSVSDAHPKLTPLVTIASTVALIAVELLTVSGVALPGLLPVDAARLPEPLALIISIVGTATVLGLATAEFIRLGRQGSSLRSGPWL